LKLRNYFRQLQWQPALKVLDAVGLALSLVLMALVAVVNIAPHIGWRVNGVRSDSMAPEINRGDLVIARPAAPAEIALDDVIVFRPVSVGETMVCHRVIEIGEYDGNLGFRTRGDAMFVSDPDWTPAANVVGKIVWHAPLIGYAAIFVQTPAGLALTLIVPGIIIILICLSAIRAEINQPKRSLAR
jgi:signal peptidase